MARPSKALLWAGAAGLALVAFGFRNSYAALKPLAARIGVFALAMAIPLVWPPVPPLVDLLGHMGRYYIQTHIDRSASLADLHQRSDQVADLVMQEAAGFRGDHHLLATSCHVQHVQRPQRRFRLAGGGGRWHWTCDVFNCNGVAIDA